MIISFSWHDTESVLTENGHEGEKEDIELPFFDIATIIHATNDFSSDKKLGRGGFGSVYRVYMQHP